ncbi:myotubularin-related protein 10-B [Lucilia cuprina]|uniref:myotubularin-related protein 10-B n=1 Tax=Lucilia cuprina TaxID=7375 RepID=UPI001F06CC94|nr:myotubularin-related protein 10-B [Lucilia cuprina]
MSATMSDQRKRNTFTSYVAPPAGDVSSLMGDDEWCIPSDMRDVHMSQPRLLAHELVVASAPAYLYTTISPVDTNLEMNCARNSKEAVFGLLSVTNFKLSFVPHQRDAATVSLSNLGQEHLLLARHDITLNNIDHVYQVAETGRAVSALPGNAGRRRKKLDAQQKLMNGRIAALHIICKNFRLMKFGFQYSKGGRDWGKLIASALARFAFPTRHDLSFAFCYKEPYYSTLSKTSVSMYNTKNDWARELIRCGSTNWQVVSCDSVPLIQAERITARYTLPPHFVIPKACDIEKFLNLSRAFWDSRAAFWVYGYGNASLVRLAELKPSNQQDTTLENIMLEVVRSANDEKKLHLLHLTDHLPSIQDVLKAYQKLRRLCCPETAQHFVLEDSKFLSLLEKSNWLFYSSLCLRYACVAAEKLREGVSCVLQESNGRDLCCIISSLTQIILDPLYRSIDGFQSLIQKEWVALEHPFQRRLGHVRLPADSTVLQEESPVFLLFLDSVWQLLQQFPDEFEFSQTYLTTLWDSCFMPIFDTFQFDTNAERLKALKENKLVLRPVWDWSEQFLEKDKLFFNNPFYQKQKQELPCRRSIAIPAGAVMLPGLAKPGLQLNLPQHQRNTMVPQNFIAKSSIPKDRYLLPEHRMSSLQIWEQCYYRFMPILEIKRGGFPQIELQHRLLLSNIGKLQRCLELQEYDDLPDVYYDLTKEPKPSVSQERRSSQTTSTDGVEFIEGVERRRRSSLAGGASVTAADAGVASILPEISSFFPFSNNTGETQQLHDILSSSQEFLLEGSIMDRLSIA